MTNKHIEWLTNNQEIDKLLAEQDRQFQEMEQTIEENGIDEEEGWAMYENWLKYGRSVVRESDVTIEGSEHIIIYQPDEQGRLWD